jgi:HlyD family secretion protein
LLTPEQRDKYRALRQSRGTGGAATSQPGRLWIVGERGEPQAIPVRVGISDGTMTEIISGDVAEGQEIILGLAAANTARTSAPTGFRF